MDEAKVKITFDKEYKIRVYDPAKFQKTEELEKECGNFVEKISSFNEKVNSLVNVLDQHANRIDAQKLRVSGCILYCPNLDFVEGYWFENSGGE